MIKWVLKSSILVIFSVIFLFIPKCHASATDIVINEIMANPETGDIEWIELFNPGPSPISITSDAYSIEDGTGSPVFIAENIIEPSGYLVLQKGIDFNFGLNNSGDTIVLKNAGVPVDQVSYGDWQSSDVPNNAPVPIKGKTLSRFPNGTDTNIDKNDFIILTPTQGFPNLKPVYPKDIIITEVFPKPVSGSADEFIEIFNSGQNIIDLSGWSIDDSDGGASSYFLSGSILPSEYRYFLNSTSGISLNDTGDFARIFDPNGDLVFSIEYSEAISNKSYSWIDNNWLWTNTPTPGAENIASFDLVLQSSVDSQIVISIAEARSKNDDDIVRVSGVVTVLPSTLSDQYFYIEDETGGIQIYSYYKTFPSLAIGQTIEITGTLSGANSDRRIKISSANSILPKQEPIVAPIPNKIELGDVGESSEGEYISVRGKIKNPSGSTFFVESGGVSIKVVINSKTKITKPRFKSDQEIEVSGIVSEYKGTYRILPTKQEDVMITYQVDYELPNTGPKDSIYLSFIISFILWIIYLTIWEKLKRLPRNLHQR